MKLPFACAIAALLLAPPVFSAPAAHQPGEVLVAISGSAPLVSGAGGSLSARSSALATVLARHGLDRSSRIGPTGDDGPATIQFFKFESSRPDFDPRAAARELRATGLFRAAIPNLHVKLVITIPNDPYVLPEQWYIQAPNDADIDLPEAWDLEHGSSSVVIGIVDTGVDLGHPDLAAKIWTNPGEIAGNLLDDDGNGYVDDVNGWDFGDGDSDPNPHPVFDEKTGIDLGFHGTFTAGIAAAQTNNSVGIAGAGWNCSILPLKVVDSGGFLTTEALAEAFAYAADQEVDILNVSLGSPGDSGVAEFHQALVDLADSAGVVCVAAAGNDATDAPFYPAACQRVIAVGAADRNNFRTSFSNWGSWVDVAAPGQEMWSTICRNYEIDEFSQIFYLYLWYWDGESPYMYGDGTSFACPLVAGTCGLLRTRYPALTATSMEAHLIATGDNVAYDLPIGKKVNAFAAMSPPAAVERGSRVAALQLGPAEPNPFRKRVAFRFTLAEPGGASLAIYDCLGRRVRTLIDARLERGAHRVEWDGTGAGGDLVESGIYFARIEAPGGRAVRRVAFMR